jgi:hypothetical protein
MTISMIYYSLTGKSLNFFNLSSPRQSFKFSFELLKNIGSNKYKPFDINW